MTTGERIKFRRTQMGMSRQDLADQLQTTAKQIWRYEKGENDPTANVLITLARILDVSVDWILGLSDEIRPISGDSSLDENEIELLRIYRAKSADSQHKILEVAKLF